MRILVTGATGAIGKEIVMRLAAKGHTMLLACRSTDKAIPVMREAIRIGAPEARVIRLDLSDSASVKEGVAEILSTGVDGVINNAGTMNGAFRLDSDGHEDTLNVNYHNTRLLNELLTPSIAQGGVIVFTTSATRRWFPLQKKTYDISRDEFSRLRAYALSKKLITAYAMELSLRLTPHGIRVNCCDPGVVDSPMLRMGKWFDPLTDRLFRPLCFSPATGADAAVRAFESDKTGRIFTAPFGSVGIPKKLFLR